MTFIITLIALVMERFFHWHHLRHWQWFIDYERKLAQKTQHFSTHMRLAISMLLPLIVIALLTYIFKGLFYGILEFAFSVVVLLYCLGPSNLWVDVYHCLQVYQTQGKQAAMVEIQKIFATRFPVALETFHENFVSVILISAHQRIFSVMFWFVVAGPFGALFYRLIELFSIRPEMGLMVEGLYIKEILDWLPIRIMVFLFTLGGHFTRAFAMLHRKISLGPTQNEAVLTECGIAALEGPWVEGLEDECLPEKNALALLDRVFVIALVILAILVLIF